MIRILCVEDEPLVRTYLQVLLNNCPGVSLAVVVDEAAAAFPLLGEGHFDVLLLDQQMHGMTGMDLLQAVRLWDEPGGKPRPRVLFHTGLADETFERRARELGADGVVAKGRDSRELLEALEVVAGGGVWFGHLPDPARRVRQAAPELPLRQVLVADAERSVRAALSALLRPFDARATPAWESADVVAMLDQHPFDLLMLDHCLPGLFTGSRLLESIEERWPSLPVVMLTNRPDAADYRPSPNVRSTVVKPVTEAGLRRALEPVFGAGLV